MKRVGGVVEAVVEDGAGARRMAARGYSVVVAGPAAAAACRPPRAPPRPAPRLAPRHAVQSLYNSPRLPRPRTVNYIANI